MAANHGPSKSAFETRSILLLGSPPSTTWSTTAEPSPPSRQDAPEYRHMHTPLNASMAAFSQPCFSFYVRLLRSASHDTTLPPTTPVPCRHRRVGPSMPQHLILPSSVRSRELVSNVQICGCDVERGAFNPHVASAWPDSLYRQPATAPITLHHAAELPEWSNTVPLQNGTRSGAPHEIIRGTTRIHAQPPGVRSA
ncbi:hypothetical protein M011DRAFT_458363 [Sporormia fimetaria CBS 119925]|uniref:Uncharacterized protein n=1 Tax=Sporormia fimetaria CBS 119925 TaxID=1340428 RepID=A0A6A6VD24_9PLEO|nr:hypothetical protein M011DRAFT_458363 [Sporormia fimetaria CBS 119925]